MTNITHSKKVYQPKGNRWKWGLRIAEALFLILFLLFLTGFGIFVYYAKDLPRPEKFSELAIAQPTKIYERTGTFLLYEVFGEEKREILALAEISDHLKEAIIATEDAEFYSHFGISPRGTARALLINLGLRPSRTSRPGGSTITQQLARTSFLTREKTVTRKIREFVLTLELERRYSKDQIFEFYLNQVPFGSNIYGVGAASEFYLQKKPTELSVAESALLAALIQAPTYYSPFGPHQEELLVRKNYVLNRMVQEGFLTKEQAEGSKQQELVFKEPVPFIRAPHFVFSALEQLTNIYGEDFVSKSGLKVYTSLDWGLQQIAESAVAEFAQQNEIFGAYNAALVALSPVTGEVLAMVGSKNWFADPFPADCTPGKDCLFDPKVNVATYQPGRQPGSAFKPFVYATAFEKGYDDKTVVVDEETNFGIWGGKEYIPQNYDGKFRGEVTLRQALAQSLNIPSVKVLVELAGIEDSVTTAKEAGITTLKNPSFYGPALVLGGGEVRLLDMVSAYGVFATNGRRIPPVTILSIEDAKGEVVWQNRNTPIQILPPQVAQLVTDILSDNEARTPIFGPRSPLYIPQYRVAVKTGTTQEFKDAWTIGYTSDIVAGVWAGNNDNTPVSKKSGVGLAAPIWNRFMLQILPSLATP